MREWTRRAVTVGLTLVGAAAVSGCVTVVDKTERGPDKRDLRPSPPSPPSSPASPLSPSPPARPVQPHGFLQNTGPGWGGGERIQRVTVGQPIGNVIASLGAPTNRRRLKNASPWTMGAEVFEYGFSRPVLAFEGQNLPEPGLSARAVQFVVDPSGRILRIVPDPNAPGSHRGRLQRGVPGKAQAVLLPATADSLVHSDG